MKQITEERLIQQAQQGDRQAFGELILRHQGQVYHYARRLLGHAADAQDITQDVFVKAYLALPQWHPKATVIAWLLRITRNTCFDLLRSQQRRPSQPLDDIDPSLLSTDTSIATQHIKAQQLQQLELAVLSLPFEQREVLILRDLEGFSYQEIAEILMLNIGTVRSRLARARAALRQKLTHSDQEENEHDPTY